MQFRCKISKKKKDLVILLFELRGLISSSSMITLTRNLQVAPWAFEAFSYHILNMNIFYIIYYYIIIW